MATLSIRSIPKELYKLLKRRADSDNRSLNQEVIWLLKESLMGNPVETNAVWDVIEKRRLQLNQTGRNFSDSVKLLRKDRGR